MAYQAPIIVPMVITRTQTCIERDGRVYCEREDLSKAMIGWIVLGVLLFFSWVAFCVWLGEKYNTALGWGLLAAPLVIGSVFLILS